MLEKVEKRTTEKDRKGKEGEKMNLGATAERAKKLGVPDVGHGTA